MFNVRWFSLLFLHKIRIQTILLSQDKGGVNKKSEVESCVFCFVARAFLPHFGSAGASLRNSWVHMSTFSALFWVDSFASAGRVDPVPLANQATVFRYYCLCAATFTATPVPLWSVSAYVECVIGLSMMTSMACTVRCAGLKWNHRVCVGMTEQAYLD